MESAFKSLGRFLNLGSPARLLGLNRRNDQGKSAPLLPYTVLATQEPGLLRLKRAPEAACQVAPTIQGGPMFFGRVGPFVYNLTTVAVAMTTSAKGRSDPSVSLEPIFMTVSKLSSSEVSPNTVYWLSRKSCRARQMKN